MKKVALGATLIAWAISSVASANQADALFQKAIAAEQAGDLAARDQWIAATLKADPAYKLARWHNGQVMHNGKWYALEKIEEAVAHDPRYQEYAERVADGDDSLASHAELARWCRAQGLQLEAEWHWFNVLRHDAKNREALGALKLRPYRGVYLTVDEIKAHEAAEVQAKAAFKRYSKLIKSAMRDAETSEGPALNAAIDKIASINDPAAISALVVSVFADAPNEQRILLKFGAEKGERVLRELQQAGIGALSEMPEHEATLNLMQIGLWASDAEIRHQAAEVLKSREPTSFVPQLMGELTMPIEYSVNMRVLSNGQVLLTEDYQEQGPLAETHHSISRTYSTQRISRTRNLPKRGNIASESDLPLTVVNDPVRDFFQASRTAQNALLQVENENAEREFRNDRVQKVLGVTFGSDKESPKEWWTTWLQFNDLYTPDRLPVLESNEEYDYSLQLMSHSCFVAGTPVWTQSGPVAIEKIKIGDFVLSQNPQTGELNFRPVLDTTVTEQSSTVRLTINEEAITTTRGHRVWVANKGWKMAKTLTAGNQLVTVGGIAEVQSTTPAEKADVYNLEVGEFHTYFVGQNRVLVHDNTCPQPTTNRLPGVPEPRAVVNQVALGN
jgi:hypothetical protein